MGKRRAYPPRNETMVNVLELERLAWPITSFAVTVFSAACTIVALATPAWVQVSYARSTHSLHIKYACLSVQYFTWLQLDVFLEQNLTGTVSFGLIRGRDDFELTVSDIDESYYICAFGIPCLSYVDHC